MKKDLDLFISITEKLLQAEIDDPVLKPVPIKQVLSELDLQLADEPAVDSEFVKTLEELVLTTPRTATKLFFNQLFGGRQSRAVLGELLSVMLNGSMYTYKVGGPQVVMEKQILEKFAQLVGYVAAGHTPFMINATAGTTVIGAFDPLVEISAVAKQYDLWLHVDGAYCGSAIFSERFKHLVKGSELADSFTLNAHKMLGTPLSCSLITVKDKKNLYSSFSQAASYLYQTADDEYNPGKISLQCGRRNDALKFWTLWKTIGTNGIEAAVDHQFDLARYAKEYVKNHPDYTLYNDDDTIAVCFNYKGIDPKTLCNKLYEHPQSKLLLCRAAGRLS